MALKEYMLDLYPIKDIDKNITEIQQQILFLYIKNEYLTVYQCWKQINEDQKLSYKNIHKHIKKLYSLKILQKKGNIGKHGSVFYKLSSFGIYFLLRKENLFLKDAKMLFEYHKNDILFETFLYPYFQKETVVKIMENNNMMISYVLHYLNQCCKEIYRFLNFLNFLENNKGESKEILNMMYSKDMRPVYFQFNEKLKKIFIIKGDKILTSIPIEKINIKEKSTEHIITEYTIRFPQYTKESYTNDENYIIINNIKDYFFELCINLIKYSYQHKRRLDSEKFDSGLLINDKIFFNHFKRFENDMKKYFAYFQSLHDEDNSE